MRFQTKAIEVHAYQHDGTLASVPDSFRVAVAGNAADGGLAVQSGDVVGVCRPGDWLVRDATGTVSVWQAGGFDQFFEPVVIEDGVPAAGSIIATWIPADAFNAPPVLQWGPYSFPQEVPVPVSDPAIVRKLMVHPQFAVSQPQAEIPETLDHVATFETPNALFDATTMPRRRGRPKGVHYADQE